VRPRARHILASVQEQVRLRIRRTFGQIAARSIQIRGNPIDDAMQPTTFTLLCDRKKFGMVEVRTALLSQLRGKPGTGIAAKFGATGAEKSKARPPIADAGRQSLNL
jgi:hypothetical protein